MAAATSIIMAATAAATIGKGIHDSNQAKKDRKRAEDRLNNMKRQPLANTYTGLSVPTQGYDLAKQATLQSQANTSGVLSQMGAQGMGSIGALSDSTRASVNEISSALTNAEWNMKQMMAGDEARIRGMQEDREQGDIDGLGAQMAFSKQQQMSANNMTLAGVAQMGEAASTIDWGKTKVVNYNPKTSNNISKPATQDMSAINKSWEAQYGWNGTEYKQ